MMKIGTGSTSKHPMKIEDKRFKLSMHIAKVALQQYAGSPLMVKNLMHD